jgi:DNA-binding transcriptional LysR family regulator
VDVGQPTLDQLRIFLAVANEGSFNKAAKKLGRALSVVSYGIAALEGQLAVKLFDREGSRRPTLTEAGRALLADARTITDDVDGLVSRARGILQGIETELALSLDVMVPSTMIAGVLRDFQAMFPTVNLRLHVEALGAVAAHVLDRQADLGVSGPDIPDLSELQHRAIGSVELVPVAAPSHPLAERAQIEPGETSSHLQLVLTDRSPLTEGREFSVFSPRTWRLADLGAKHALLLDGIGWGIMPRHMVADDLDAGRLVALRLPEAPSFDYRLNALWRKDSRPGPAAVWMLDALIERCPTPASGSARATGSIADAHSALP